MSNRGFTLVEVVFVVSISLILGSIALVSYRSHIRSAYQTEAQVNLAEVSQIQKSFETEGFEYDPDLKGNDVKFIPRGRLRYNIGAIWSGIHSNTSLYPSSTGSTDPHICPLCSLSDIDSEELECCMIDDDAYSALSDAECFGHTGGITQANLATLGCSAVYEESNASGNDRAFRYYATGCVSDEIEENKDIDVWSITDHFVLSNHRDATQREDTCD